MEENRSYTENGGISVKTEHIFPVIKKWLYSDKDIFLREIVSNACDAITKLSRLSSLGKFTIDENEKFKVEVVLDKDERTITVSDNGIGMNREELKKYICNIALSGALEFIEKYEGESEGASNGIIGHFGLGFYSSFMVSDTVEVISSSYDGSDAVQFECNDAGSYSISEANEPKTRGTDVVMHISEEESEYLSVEKLRAILDKYCSFMPYEIYLYEKDADEEKEREAVNDTHPMWQKNPSDCTEEEYKEFYRKVFNDWREPLFHIHLKADYPLNFKGILYFPSVKNEFESIEGQIKLYYNQVFVADNIKEVMPDYLIMMRGILDCPELPLNVSRSYLQDSGYVSKISAHIAKKVADKINSLYNVEREKYETMWDDLKVFVQYGAIRDRKFFERVKDAILLKCCDGKHLTVKEYLEAAKEKHENKVYYAQDTVSQAQFISMYEKEGIKVAHLNSLLDVQFITMLEEEFGVKFFRVDTDVADALKTDGEAGEYSELAEIFKKASGNDALTVSFAPLKDAEVPALLNISEQTRRIEDMMKMYGQNPFSQNTAASLILNTENTLVKKLIECSRSESIEAIADAARHVYMLALLSQRPLNADELKELLERSYKAIEKSV